MNTDTLRAKVIATLGLTDANKEEQESALYKVEAIAHKRFGAALPELLTDEQLDEIDKMRTAGKTPEEVTQWIEDNLPNYQEMIQAVIEDVAQEVADL